MNKVKLLISISFITCTLLSYSQTNNNNKYRLGVYGSLNFNRLNFQDEAISTITRPSLGFGLIYDKFFAENYAVSTGIDIRRQSASFSYFAPVTGTEMLEEREVDVEYNYVQIPIALKMHVNEFYFFTPFVRFGGTLGIARNNDIQVTSPSGVEINRLNRDFLMSFMISLGTYYQIGENTNLYFCFDYNQSLLNNIDKDKIPQLINEQPRFSWFTFSAGITF